MKHFVAILIMIGLSQNANGEECPTTNARGENCISSTPSVERDGDWVTYKQSLTNSCDCSCNAILIDTDGVRRGDIVAPRGKGEVICLNVRGKGCRGFEKSFDFTCQREGAASSNPPRPSGPNSAGSTGQVCADYKRTCTDGCSQRYPLTSENYHNCMTFCSLPCSNGTVREANPYLKSESTNSNQGRKFSKDECRDERCANADFDRTASWRLKDAAKAICDQQYLQCLQDGQAKPDPEEAWRIAKAQVPAEAPTPEPQPAPTPVPSRPVYQSQTYGQLVDCFWDPIFLSKGGVPMCLGPSWMRAQQPGCFTPDIVNGQQAYICQGADQGPEMFRSRKSQYGGGRSW
jgi:hypothetical protein